MPRKAGSRQNAALRQIVANAPSLRSTVSRAQQNANASGGTITRELNRLSARGNTNATTILSLMRRGGASTGGNGG